MTYIYDILLNFNNDFYEFYEWEKKDQIYHIKKIPIFKINTEDIENIFLKKIKLTDLFTNLIYNKTELFGNKRGKYLKYSCLLTDSYKVIGILLNDNLEIINISDLLLDEAFDTINISSRVNKINLEYTIIGNKKYNYFLTRKEKEIKKYLEDELKNIYSNKEDSKLQYLYFEYFNKNSIDKTLAYKELKNSLKKEVDEKHINLYNLLNLKDEYQKTNLTN